MNGIKNFLEFLLFYKYIWTFKATSSSLQLTISIESVTSVNHLDIHTIFKIFS